MAFLFTDIEGSTRLWERYPEAMRDALARHDALMRSAIEEHGGHVFKTIGDAFCAAFHSADDGLRAALRAQLTLSGDSWKGGLDLRVRMALHQGDCQHRDSDYFGQPLNRVSRLLAIGHGGQILLSETARASLQLLPDQVTLLDLGVHELRDVRDPMEVWQIVHPDLTETFPPLRSESPRRTNLPAPTTAFIGRRRELEDLRRLSNARLLTLTGIGGTGKTRLSLEFGARRLEEFRHGVWFVELEPLADPTLLPQVIAETLQIREAPGEEMARELLDALRERHMLLILDNCEHLLKSVAEFADTLLRACPRLSIMATSREALGVHGEVVYPLLPLPEADAVALFTDRAVLARPNFAVGQDSTEIARLCRRLDGLPLALELAAARVRVLTVEQIEERLEDRFHLLTGGGPNQSQQRTLRDLIDWSYELLDDREKSLLVRLGVFVGGWTIEAAESVCGDDQLADWEVLDLLSALVDKSLLLVEEGTEGVRYRMLETIRQYARDRLAESGEEDRYRARHAAYFLQFAEGHYTFSEQSLSQEALEKIERDYDDLRFALDYLAASPEGGIPGLRLATSLASFWNHRGYIREGRTRFTTALAHPGAQEPTAYRAVCLNAAGNLAHHQGDYPAALALYSEALSIYHLLHDAAGAAEGFYRLGSVYSDQAEYERAYGYLKEALAIRRRRQEPERIAAVQLRLGMVLTHQEDSRRAIPLLEESYRLARAHQSPQIALDAALALGTLSAQRGEPGVAREWFSQALPLCREMESPAGLVSALLGLAYAARVDEHYNLAIRFSGAQEVLREDTGAPLEGPEREQYNQHLAELRTTLGSDLFDAIFRAGYAMTRTEAWAEAYHYAVSPDEAAEGTIQVM